ncbi:MAG: hypothetical protein JNK87_17160 [Bryobacterales bacterium]|nr:hypothetical protein [Bryobacterales bacterium]
MGFGEKVLNIVSWGAHDRVRSRAIQYDAIRLRVRQAYAELEGKRDVANRTLEDLVLAKTAGVFALRKLRRISENIQTRDRATSESPFDLASVTIPLAHIENTLSTAEIAMNGAQGAGAGLSTALGTWALVGTFGTASTGTAIGTLSGAAATKATLAWLGGGSLASGGLGMGVGTAVLGGMVFIPAVVITGIFSHLSANKRIKEIEEEASKSLVAIGQYKELSLKLDAVDRRASELSRSVRKAVGAFDSQFCRTCRAVYPFGVLSRAFRYLRRLFGGRYFSEADLFEISPLLQIAAALAELIDVRIMDETGNLS